MKLSFGKNFELLIWCDVVPMKVAHIVLENHGFFMKRSNMMDIETLICLYVMGSGSKKILRLTK